MMRNLPGLLGLGTMEMGKFGMVRKCLLFLDVRMDLHTFRW